MKLTGKHAQVGYLTPQARPGCGNCKALSAGEENGFGQVLYRVCGKHRFEVRAGGVCGDHEPELRNGPKLGIDSFTGELFA